MPAETSRSAEPPPDCSSSTEMATRQLARRLRMADAFPELDPRLLDPEEVARAEPALRGRGCGPSPLATGFPVPPAAATEAWADLAEQRGRSLLVGSPGASRHNGRSRHRRDPRGRDADRRRRGPGGGRTVDAAARRRYGGWRPIVPTYGVTLHLRLDDGGAPRHVLEEDVVDDDQPRRSGHRAGRGRRLRRGAGAALQHRHGERRQHTRLHVPSASSRTRQPSSRCFSAMPPGSCPRSRPPR